MWIALLLCLRALAAPVLSLPYTLDPVSGHLRVQASIGEAPPASFVFDTGAPLAIVSREHWREAGRDPEKGFRKSAHGAGGSAIVLRLATDATLRVPAPDGSAQSLPLAIVAVGEVPQIPGSAPVAGLLGIDLFRGRIAEIDLSAHVIRLHPLDGDPVPGVAWQKLRRGRGRLLRAEVQLGETPLDALVDLGSGTTMLNPVAGALPEVSRLPACEGEARGLDGLPIPLTCARATLRFAGHTLSPRKLTTGAAGIFPLLRMHRKPAVVLGNDALRSGKLLVDLKRRRIAWTGPDRALEALEAATCTVGCTD